MDNTIIIEVNTHYGTDFIYIVSAHKTAIEKLTRKKTINSQDVIALKMLGFEFIQKQKILI